jgi:hypothetical protein
MLLFLAAAFLPEEIMNNTTGRKLLSLILVLCILLKATSRTSLTFQHYYGLAF